MPKPSPTPPSNPSHDLDVARTVLETAIAGIRGLEEALDASFSAALDVILGLKGRVIISGMGKSGHVARKIAATLSSTGTPAHFVHPAEASHGDLGMITENDAVLLLSNSGETNELKDIIAYAKRFSIPLIAVVRRKESMLTEAADIAFVLPEIPEASPVGAPTTSTTMMLVWGDALAIALLERKGFNHEDFHTFHPGGKLGSQLITAGQIMKQGDDVPLVSGDTPMSDVLITMTAKSLGCTGVVDAKNRLIGVITDGDLRRHMGDALITTSAEEIMTKDPITIPPSALASEVLSIMNARAITSIFVVEEGALQGIVHIHDILRSGVA